MNRTTRALGATVIAISALAISTSAAFASGPPSGFVGNWTTIDCAATGDNVDCGVWGDGSVMTLTIGPGETPHAVFQDSYATVCADNDSSATRWVAAGSGEYAGDHLWLQLLGAREVLHRHPWAPAIIESRHARVRPLLGISTP